MNSGSNLSDHEWRPSRECAYVLSDAATGTDASGVHAIDWSRRAIDSVGTIAEDQVELWRVELDAIRPDSVRRLRQTLSIDEGARADRFRFERDRRRFTIARGTLRRLLARHLGCSPAAITFRYGPAGKPAIVEPAAGVGLHFNVTHAGNLALIAITRAGEVGIDVEQVCEMPDWEGVAKLVFSPEHVSQMHSLAEPMRLQAFFRAWTRKEAVAKAGGTGLGGVDIEEARSVSSFSFSPHWVASLAAPASARFLTCHTWESDDFSLPVTVRQPAPFEPAAADSVVTI